MPIYEYECRDCGRISGHLVMKPAEAKGLRCRHCEGRKLARVLSRFTHHQTEAQRLDAFDTTAPKDERFYKDTRNIGLHAKKRAKELGADLGESFDQRVEKARSGRVEDL